MESKAFKIGEPVYHKIYSETVSSPWSCIAVDDKPGELRPLLGRLVEEEICSQALSLPFGNLALELLNGNSVKHTESVSLSIPNIDKCILLLDMRNQEDQTFEGYDKSLSEIAGAQFYNKIKSSFKGEVVLLSNFPDAIEDSKKRYPSVGRLSYFYKGASDDIEKDVEDAIVQYIKTELVKRVSLVEVEVDGWRNIVEAGENFQSAHHLPPKGQGNIQKDEWFSWIDTEIANSKLYRILNSSGYKINPREMPNFELKHIWKYNGLYPRLRDLAAICPERTNDNPLLDYFEYCENILSKKYDKEQNSISVSVKEDITVNDPIIDRLNSKSFDYLGFNVIALMKLLDCMAAGLHERISTDEEGTLNSFIDIYGSTERCSVSVSIEEPNFSLSQPAFQVFPNSTRGENRGGHMAAVLRYARTLGASQIHVMNNDLRKKISLNRGSEYMTNEVKDNSLPVSGFTLNFEIPFVLRS